MELDPKRVQVIFLRAAEHQDPEARIAILDHECSTDVPLRRRVEALLRAYDRSADIEDHALQPSADFTVDYEPASSERAAASPGAPTPTIDSAASRTISEGIGARIGPYVLLERIGEGGMGTVYMAEQQEPIRRRVALKIIKPGMDSEQVVARFGAERQALAIMDHQNIAKVFDAGTTATGRPYFAMELVQGVPITTYCDQAQLATRERLELFIGVCQAIQHAHQKGIIHRDIKPSNILVTLYDGKPVPKVIDFGIAKAIDQPLGERTMTQYGAIVGTLEYMSPEQAELSALGIDTRSDIYSLGVVLYELLTGNTPLDRERLIGSGYIDILKRIKEEEPPKPSTRLSLPGERRAAVAAQRNSEPARLAKLLRGELDWIVMKAIEKDRARRYDSAGDFARDVRRFLDHEPVEAGRPSAAYRLRKLAIKHRAALATVAGFAALLILGAVLSAWQAYRATRAEGAARRETNRALMAEARAENDRSTAVLAETHAKTEEANARRSAGESQAVLKFFQDQVLAAARPEDEDGGLGKDATIRDAVDAAEPKIEAAFAGQPAAEASIRYVLGKTYNYLGDPELSVHQHTRALELRMAQFGPNHPDTLHSRFSLAMSYYAAGQLEKAVALFEETLEGRIALLGPDHSDTLSTQTHLGRAYRDAGQLERATTLLERTLAAQTVYVGPTDPGTLTTKFNLALTYGDANKLERSIALLEEALTGWRQRVGPAHPDLLATQEVLAARYSEAGQSDRAIPIYQQVLATLEAKLGLDHPVTLSTQNNLASALQKAKQLDPAISLFESTLAAKKKKLGPDHPSTVTTQNNLGRAYRDAGRLNEAIPLLERTLAVVRVEPRIDLPDLPDCQQVLIATYEDLGDFARAEPLLREMLDAKRTENGSDHPEVASRLALLAANLMKQGKWADAEPVLRECLTIREQKLPDDWLRFNTQSMLGGSLLGQQKYDEAEPLLVAGYEGLKVREAKLPEQSQPRLIEAAKRVIQLYESWDKPEEATQWRAKLTPKPGGDTVKD